MIQQAPVAEHNLEGWNPLEAHGAAPAPSLQGQEVSHSVLAPLDGLGEPELLESFL